MENLNQQAAQRAAEQAQRAQQAAVKHAHHTMVQAQETARRSQQLRMAMQNQWQQNNLRNQEARARRNRQQTSASEKSKVGWLGRLFGR
jgi:hypothetical protein